MSGIKSLADELRESIKNGKQPDTAAAKNDTPVNSRKKKDNAVDELINTLESYELAGKEKLLIRLDERTVFLMKQLKVARGIDMNKLIAFSLQNFLERHPQLIQYIKDTIKSIEL